MTLLLALLGWAVAADPADLSACRDLGALQEPAILRALTPAQIACLEARLRDEADPKARVASSLFLIYNAEGTAGWATLLRRHLEEIDTSDPDLCYLWALHLTRGGIENARDVIRWAEAALQNRSRWTGETYTVRVSRLATLKTEAANLLWRAAARSARMGTVEPGLADGDRDLVARYAQEWLQVTTDPREIRAARRFCRKAGGNCPG